MMTAKILAKDGLCPLFQPIVSISGKNIWGYEGLIRGLDPQTSAVIPPQELFEMAAGENVTVKLDAACQSAVLREYAGKARRGSRVPIFINTHATTVMEDVSPARLVDETVRYGLQPADIVIEIDESEVADTGMLSSFIGAHRERGFLIAFDDFGTDSCSLERIHLFRPDFVKLDISLMHEIHLQRSAQEEFTRILAAAHAAGATVIAEGVEDEREAEETLRLGGDLIQGFYFSRPAALSSFNSRITRRITALCQCAGNIRAGAELVQGKMRPELTVILACPECRQRLEVSPVEERDGGIGTGVLRCAGCRSAFPIVNGIPVMLMPEEPYSGM